MNKSGKVWRSTERPGHAGYTLTNPIKSDGSLTKYMRIVMVVKENGPISKADIMKALGHEMTGFRYKSMRMVNPWLQVLEETHSEIPYQCPSRLCSTFAALRKIGLLGYNMKTRKWHVGPSYETYLRDHFLTFSRRKK